MGHNTKITKRVYSVCQKFNNPDVSLNFFRRAKKILKQNLTRLLQVHAHICARVWNFIQLDHQTGKSCPILSATN